jgi:hypothetical protein
VGERGAPIFLQRLKDEFIQVVHGASARPGAIRAYTGLAVLDRGESLKINATGLF